MSEDAIGEVLVTEEDLQRRVAELGAEVSRDYEGRRPLLVAILKGAVPFLADLMRHLTVDCELDFMAVSSYGSSTDSSGVVRILKDLDAPIADRDVLIVEDIIDSGLTLHYLLRNLQARGPHPAGPGTRPTRETFLPQRCLPDSDRRRAGVLRPAADQPGHKSRDPGLQRLPHQ